MKKFLLFVGIFLLTTAGFAQTDVPAFDTQGAAEIDLNKCVTLDNSVEVQNYYLIDIATNVINLWFGELEWIDVFLGVCVLCL